MGDWPEGLRNWDDTRRDGRTTRKFFDKKLKKTIEQQWGAGWKAESFEANPKGAKMSKWFNVKCWGTWRLSFLMARLQRSLWYNKELAAGRTPASSTGAPGVVTPRKRRRGAGFGVLEKSSSKKSAVPFRRKLKSKSGQKKQPTMLNFFKRKVVEEPPPPRFVPVTQQAVLTSFFKAKHPKAEKDSGDNVTTDRKDITESAVAASGDACSSHEKSS